MKRLLGLSHRRQIRSAGYCAALESRLLLAGTATVPGFTITGDVNAVSGPLPITITDFVTSVDVDAVPVWEALQIGDVQFRSGVLDADNLSSANGVFGAAYDGEHIAVIMDHGAESGRQMIDRSSGAVSSFETFRSTRDVLNGSNLDRSFLRGVTRLTDGRLVYYGWTDQRIVLDPAIPTFWFAPDDPHIASDPSSPIDYDGIIDTINPNGMVGGVFLTTGTVEGVLFPNRAFVGTLSTLVKGIPSGSGTVLDISDDGKYLVGSDMDGTGLWREVSPGSMQYERINNSHWEAIEGALETPREFQYVVQSEFGYIIPAPFLTDTFQARTAIYNLETGELLALTEIGDSPIGAAVYRGNVVIAVAGDNGGAFYVIGPNGVSERIDLSQILGEPANFAGYRSFSTLFDDGGLGFVAGTEGGYKVRAYSLELTGGLSVKPQYHFEVQSDHGNYFTSPPQITASGDLSFSLKNFVSGTVHVQMRIVDDGHPGLVSDWQSFEIEVQAGVAAVDAVVHQGNYAPGILSLNERTFEVGLKGTAEFDVTTINKASLWIGDERNAATGKIVSMRFTDENKDGFKDAILKVQTSGAVRADTTRLKITGRTMTGGAFDGSRAITMTAQSWQAHWQSTSGNVWRSLFTTYTKGLKRTWW